MINSRNSDFNPEQEWTLDIGTVSRKLLERPGELSIKENKVIPAE